MVSITLPVVSAAATYLVRFGFIGLNFWSTVALNQEKQLGLYCKVAAFERMMS
jgi:hypothetical protein